MAVFAYQAIHVSSASSGRGSVNRLEKTVRGTIGADSPAAAREMLRGRGLKIQKITRVRGGAEGAAARRWHHGFHPRREASLLVFTSELATLLGAGIPLLCAIETIARQQRGDFRESLMLLRDKIAAGVGLAAAMRGQPELFDELSVSLVEVGEKAGTLDQVLRELARFKQRSANLKGKIATALIYPCIVLVTGVGVTIFLMTFVVPKLLESLVDAGRPLPLATRVVKGLSDLLVDHGWLLGLGVAAIVAGVAGASRRLNVKRAWHGLVLRLPLWGPLCCKQAVVRIAVTMATLIRSGVEFLQAVRIAQNSTGNLVLREALAEVEESIRAGREIAPALEATGVFPGTVVQVFALGQESGRLDDVLDQLASDYDLQVQTATQRLLAMLEPAVILLLAGLIGLVVLAVILPYLEVGNVL